MKEIKISHFLHEFHCVGEGSSRRILELFWDLFLVTYTSYILYITCFIFYTFEAYYYHLAAMTQKLPTPCSTEKAVAATTSCLMFRLVHNCQCTQYGMYSTVCSFETFYWILPSLPYFIDIDRTPQANFFHSFCSDSKLLHQFWSH